MHKSSSESLTFWSLRFDQKSIDLNDILYAQSRLCLRLNAAIGSMPVAETDGLALREKSEQYFLDTPY
jgi:hypothetical protein